MMKPQTTQTQQSPLQNRKESAQTQSSQDLPATAQEQHDLEMSQTEVKLASKKDLAALMSEAKRTSLLAASSTNFDPIESAMARHPQLTREKAERRAKALGFQ